MGRKAKPSAVKELTGAFDKNPQRRNEDEPKPSSGMPTMPEIVAGDSVASQKWADLCAWLEDMGMLTDTDRDLMTAYCMNWSRMLAANAASRDELVLEGKAGPIRNPMSLEFHKCADRHVKLMAELGLTPSSRAGLKTTNNNQSDPMADYIKTLSKIATRN